MATGPESGNAPMEPGILINVFEVPEGKDEEFLARLAETRKHMQAQDGFLSTKLHQSLDPRAQFRYINISQWKTPQHHQTALKSPEFQKLVIDFPAKAHPMMYRVLDQ